MINNDVLRSIRYMLDLGDGRVVDIIQLADPAFAFDKADVQACLTREGEEGHVECSDAVLAHFLDGLVIHAPGVRRRRFPGVQAGTFRAVPPARPQELPRVRRPVASQLPQGPDDAGPWDRGTGAADWLNVTRVTPADHLRLTADA